MKQNNTLAFGDMEFIFSCSIWCGRSNWTLEDKFHISARPFLILCELSIQNPINGRCNLFRDRNTYRRTYRESPTGMIRCRQTHIYEYTKYMNKSTLVQNHSRLPIYLFFIVCVSSIKQSSDCLYSGRLYFV